MFDPELRKTKVHEHDFVDFRPLYTIGCKTVIIPSIQSRRLLNLPVLIDIISQLISCQESFVVSTFLSFKLKISGWQYSVIYYHNSVIIPLFRLFYDERFRRLHHFLISYYPDDGVIDRLVTHQTMVNSRKIS